MEIFLSILKNQLISSLDQYIGLQLQFPNVSNIIYVDNTL